MSEVDAIPDSWRWVEIQDIATTATGGTPNRRINEYFGGEIPWVKSGELGDGRVFESEESLTNLGLSSSNAKLFPKGTLCVALYGATVGKLGVLEMDAATNQAVCGIFLPSIVDRQFVFHYLASIRKKLIQQAKGGAQPNISNGLIRQTRIPIAPLNEQRRIVGKIEELFSDLDAGVAALERARANLKRYRAAVLKAAVEGDLTAEWRAQHPDTEPASQLLTRILKQRREKWEADQLTKLQSAGKEPPKNWREKYVEPSPPDTNGLPELPKEWCWTTMELLASETSNSIGAGPFGTIFKAHDFRDAGIPIIFLRHVQPGKYVTRKPGFMDLHKWEQLFKTEYSVFGGELLVTKLGEPPGTAAIYPYDIGPAMVTPDVIKMRPEQNAVCAEYLMHYMNSVVGKAFASGVAFGTTRMRLTLPLFKDLPVPLPPLREQKEITAAIAEAISQIDAAEAAIARDLQRAGRLRQSILQQAFTGQLVPQDPTDEPASALLDRLRPSPASSEKKAQRSRTNRATK
jgi:type I restriction enzyme, S subunit